MVLYGQLLLFQGLYLSRCTFSAFLKGLRWLSDWSSGWAWVVLLGVVFYAHQPYAQTHQKKLSITFFLFCQCPFFELHWKHPSLFHELQLSVWYIFILHLNLCICIKATVALHCWCFKRCVQPQKCNEDASSLWKWDCKKEKNDYGRWLYLSHRCEG